MMEINIKFDVMNSKAEIRVGEKFWEVGIQEASILYFIIAEVLTLLAFEKEKEE